MRQPRLFLRKPRGASDEASWPSIVAANPEQYDGLLLRLALQALHQAGKPHCAERCEACRQRAGSEFGSDDDWPPSAA